MVNADQTVALSASILALLALISVSMFVCMFLIYWRYRSNEKRKTRWTDSPSQLRTGWLATDREILVPGQFSAKIVQPQMPNTSDTSVGLSEYIMYLRAKKIFIVYRDAFVRDAPKTSDLLSAHHLFVKF